MSLVDLPLRNSLDIPKKRRVSEYVAYLGRTHLQDCIRMHVLGHRSELDRGTDRSPGSTSLRPLPPPGNAPFRKAAVSNRACGDFWVMMNYSK
jgi:hypothetical protein